MSWARVLFSTHNHWFRVTLKHMSYHCYYLPLTSITSLRTSHAPTIKQQAWQQWHLLQHQCHQSLQLRSARQQWLAPCSQQQFNLPQRPVLYG
jgi:hypothetical protein